MEQLQETAQLKRKTIISTFSLFFQSGYSAVLGLAANLVLTILVSPAIFGIYITVLSIISIFNYFSDIGLAASLVQKKEVNEDDLKTAFTSQQLLIIFIAIIGVLASNLIKNFYQLPAEGIYLYWALILSFFLSSLKTIPSVLLERKIQFQKIVSVQIVENTVFYLTVIILAVMNFGLTSFTIAVIGRSLVGLVMIYSISFWRPIIGISTTNLKQLLRFGLPFQTNSLLALVKDDFITLFLGKMLGFEKLGYIGWAKKWAEAPIRIIMDNLSRVMFPLFARFQENRERLGRVVEKIIYYQTAVILPTIIGAGLLMDKFIAIVLKYSKWLPAINIFYLFCISAFLATFSTPFINLFNALGKVRVSFFFMIVWTVLTWILTPILTNSFDLYGFPLTLIILSSLFVLVVFQAKKFVHFRFLKPIYPFFISGLIMGLSVWLIKNLILSPLPAFLTSIAGGIIVYNISLYLLFRINLLKEFVSLFNNLKS